METGDPMEEHYSQLTEAIMKAISNSPEIPELLTTLKEQGLITRESYFNFILSVDELSTLLDIPSGSDSPYKLEPSSEIREKEKRVEVESGEIPELSENEVRFEEFYQKMFNEQEWLKKARLKF